MAELQDENSGGRPDQVDWDRLLPHIIIAIAILGGTFFIGGVYETSYADATGKGVFLNRYTGTANHCYNARDGYSCYESTPR